MNRIKNLQESFKKLTTLMEDSGWTPPKQGATLADWLPEVVEYIETLKKAKDVIEQRHTFSTFSKGKTYHD